VTQPSIFETLGGREGIKDIVRDFYERVAADPDIRPVYPEDLTPGRDKLALFFEQWFSGEPVYSALYGHPRLRRRHFPFVIDEKHAGRWLHHMRAAMQNAGVPRDTQGVIFERLAPLARQIVNAHEDVPREPLGDAVLQ
jgi:hemoglobin